MKISAFVTALLCFFIIVMPVSAGMFDLTIKGKVYTQDDIANNFEQHTLDIKPHQIYWTKEAGVFAGPRLKDVLKDAGFDAKIVSSYALDDFTNEVAYELVEKYDPILAISVNGKRLELATKGPFRIIWPSNIYPELATTEFRFKWVWMLATISEK